jgi:formylglycine-generating enzyme required for sulfatase activity
VCEWIEDVWHPNYAGAPDDGSAWLTASGGELGRTIRGGAWDYLPRLLRSAWRDSLPRTHHRDNTGFRVALTLTP